MTTKELLEKAQRNLMALVVLDEDWDASNEENREFILVDSVESAAEAILDFEEDYIDIDSDSLAEQLDEERKYAGEVNNYLLVSFTKYI